MTTPEPPADSPTPTPSAPTGLPLRSLTAWALIAIAAVTVFFALLLWIFPTFRGMGVSRFSIGSFVSFWVIVPPLLAMLVATRLGPALKSAKLMSLVALGTYAAAALFGLVSFFVRIADRFDGIGDEGGIYSVGQGLQTFGGLITDLLALTLLVLAGLWTYKLSAGLGLSIPAVKLETEES